MDDLDVDIKPILTKGDETLRSVSTPVTEFDEDLHQLVVDMINTMMTKRGIGLSAVQINITKRVIIAYDDKKIHVLVNPEFVRKLNREVVMQEGCLSLPGVYRNISRPAKCEVKFQNLDGHEFIVNYSGMLARIIQHEMDHLDGILITDKPVT